MSLLSGLSVVRLPLVFVTSAMLLSSGCALAPKHPVRSPLGAPVELLRTNGGSIRGELLAASPDSIWILRAREEGGALAVVAMTEARAVRVRHGNVSVPRSALAGLLVGIAVSVQSYGNNWASEGSTIMTIFGLSGLFVGVERAAISTITISPPTGGALSAWARFPQGMPGSAMQGLRSLR